MFRLAHISDVHLGPLPGVTYRELASKRVVGYVNWQRNRRRHMHDAVIDTIVADLKASQPDHLAVTGDLVNLALDGEIEMARHWLETLGSPDNVSVVPGNHDAYVPGAFDKVCRSWAAWMSGDGTGGPVDRNAFPYLRVRGNVALIGVSTARATAPFMANGFFRAGQARRLGKILDATAGSGLFRVVMIHHPPVRGAVSQYKRLFGIELFQRTVNRHGAELVLHGHSHDPSLFFIGTRGVRIPVVGVAAAGQGLGGRHPAAQYNLVDIEGEKGDWQVRLTRRGLTGPAMPPSDLQVIELGADAEASRPLVKS
ncbi:MULTISPECIES: metallophosphoesterase [unclassified Mesorhizobium]|uniref:metallophosphoesterase family protein n=1 Tax=unclassified Mesorhizobium TaxID=325217 RepID=UPI000FCAEA41|nr:MULTISPECIES: metallophosphoesterase [unclassified Mesorhizobium]RUW75570.1 metallophosphoesterase [Mesorhizobium sp. M4B.F.Ca.ET.049.02.1.2]RWA62609.1 MAG: metallophosphoesterase [Mesorhizobium sp.]TGV28464.1 metallophosphoesterase [Mesorhizobium sp. M4B.F.Ca.ET.143.01.1.1]